jgi:hypothetical protein
VFSCASVGWKVSTRKNTDMVLDALGYVSPFGFEAMYYDKINPLGQVA